MTKFGEVRPELHPAGAATSSIQLGGAELGPAATVNAEKPKGTAHLSPPLSGTTDAAAPPNTDRQREAVSGEAAIHPATKRVARWWRSCLETAGVRYRNPHLARHTFATNWLRGGGRLETLKLVLGHASFATTSDLYGHLDTTDVLADLALIEGRA